jgi:hypothetical protein
VAPPAQHRRHGADGGRAAFVRLVVVELAVMALVVAVAVVLARTPPPGVPGG